MEVFMEDILTLYKNIKNRRQELGLSQEELAKKVGYKDRTSIAKIEGGKVDLSQSKIIEFANVLGVPPSYLMGWDNGFRKDMYAVLRNLGIEKHTPHDCRHTFAMLCDESGVKETDKKFIMGHAFQDVSNAVYGHRTLAYLKAQIELIKVNK